MQIALVIARAIGVTDDQDRRCRTVGNDLDYFVQQSERIRFQAVTRV